MPNQSTFLIYAAVLLSVASLVSGFTTNHYLRPLKNLVKEDLKFYKACPEENHKFDESTGNFLCIIPTAKDCFAACQEVGCTEWFFSSLMSPKSEVVHRYHRCRCVPEVNICMYNPVPAEYRDFD